MNSKIRSLIDEETQLKDRLKNLKSDLNELFEETGVYKSVFEAALESTKQHKVSEKVARDHALKVTRAVFTPKDEES
jgi:predicted  nucleic acid-binding Zn-ribbon protein